MMNEKHRILVVDDNRNIFSDFQAILVTKESDSDLEGLRFEIFGKSEEVSGTVAEYDLDYANQGEAAVEMVAQAVLDGNPYRMAFVDMRMPPGWDGLKTIQHIWEEDKRIQAVICTAYSDYSWQKISCELKRPQDFLILKKPFDKVEVSQIAASLTKKWTLARKAQINQEQLELLVEERTRELSETNRTLEKAIEHAEMMTLRAKKASESKSTFLAKMSHEIRTPMNAIIGFSEILLSSEKNPSRHNHLKMITESAHSLLKLINGILDFSKIEAGKVTLEKRLFSLNKLLCNVSSLFFVSAREKGLEFKIDIDDDLPEFFIGDDMRLRQVLINLLGNAVKFTQKGAISVHAVYRYPVVVIHVMDTGVGIPDERFTTIFEKFEQADNSIERQFGGSGLGLAISLSLVRLMGGEINVKSRGKKGTVFTLELPFEVSKAPADCAKIHEKGHAILKPIGRVRCLVVEDNIIDIKLVTIHLGRMDIEYEVAENGKIALALMCKTAYDFILLDMHMPVMDGLGTLAAMKNNGPAKKIPVIALTADAIKGHKEKCLNAGCCAYLSKPFSLQELQMVILELFPHLFACSTEDSGTGNLPIIEAPHLNTIPIEFSLEEITLIQKGLDVLKKNSDIFNPEELESLSVEMMKKTKVECLTKLAGEIREAAEKFDDSLLEGFLSDIEQTYVGDI